MARKNAAVTADATEFEDIGDLSDLSYADTLEYRIINPASGKPTTWVWTLAGPAHSVTLALEEKIMRQEQEEEAKHIQARIAAAKANKPEPKRPNSTPAENRAKNAENLAGRVLGFTPVKLDGVMYEYSHENAVKLLADPSKDWIWTQIFNAATSKLGFMRSFAET